MPKTRAKGILISLAVIGLGLGWGLWSLVNVDYDVLDRFVVIGVESDARAGHAVTFQYDHANSSRQVLAVWILPQPRTLGSTQPVRERRQPVLATIASRDLTSLTWTNGRLTATLREAVEVRRNGASECMFAYERTNLVCVDPTYVDVR